MIVRALDTILLLHADHEQNCSTSTVRMVGSSEANLFASVAAGVSALWGPLHGGANVAVVDMLDSMLDEGLSVKDFVGQIKDKKNGIRLMGFGHRVYKNFDPRAKIIKGICNDVLAKLSIDDPMLSMAEELEAAAARRDYFVSRKLYPNVDFYSGVILPGDRHTKGNVYRDVCDWPHARVDCSVAQRASSPRSVVPVRYTRVLRSADTCRCPDR